MLQGGHTVLWCLSAVQWPTQSMNTYVSSSRTTLACQTRGSSFVLTENASIGERFYADIYGLYPDSLRTNVPHTHTGFQIAMGFRSQMIFAVSLS